MATFTDIRVIESGSIELDAATATSAMGEPMLWQLVSSGYIAVEALSRGRAKVTTRTYVGRAQLGPRSFEIAEKIPGETEALLGWATHRSFKVERAPAPASSLGRLIAILVHEFVRDLRSHVSVGRIGEYRARREISPLVGGKIRMPETIGLRSRGLRHLVAFDRSIFTFDTEANRVFLATLRDIERLAAILPLAPGDVATARGLSLIFEDCLTAQFLVTQRSAFINTARSLIADERDRSIRDLLELAVALLGRVSMEMVYRDGERLPRAWFIDLGSLFEDVITDLLSAAAEKSITVEEGSATLPRIFGAVRDRYRADPDLVCRDEAGRVVAVGDVKHKQWTGHASEEDVYQLLVHAAAFKSARSFLVYPAADFTEVALGAATTGSQASLFSVDVRDLPGSMARVAVSLGIAQDRVAAA